MANINFLDIVKLINNSRITEINIIPLSEEKNRWALFRGENKVPGFKYPFFILYLYPSFIKDSIVNAFKAIQVPSATQIVYSENINQNNLDELIKLVDSNKIAGVSDLKAYFLTFIQDRLKVYIDNLNSLRPNLFIEPHYQTPAGFKRRTPNPIYSFLIDDYETPETPCLPGILCAEPGQGKTYTTKYLTCRLIDAGFIPIYIHSSQWNELKEDELNSLYKTIVHSFRYFGASIDWLENIEEEFIKKTLELGLFKIIFDGFDEYVLWNKGKIVAGEIIQNLIDLSKETNARILVTSRTTFWNSSVNISELDESHPNYYLYNIQPFDLEQAENYFKKRFESDHKAFNRAKELFSLLKSKSKSQFAQSFAGRGFVINLIADLCSSDDDITTYDGSISIIQWIMYSFCQRERIRQSLPIKAEQQLQILRQFAESKAMGEVPNTNLLRNIIEVFCDYLTKEDLDGLISHDLQHRSLNDHPLIGRDCEEEDLWSFRDHQVELNLLAEKIYDDIKNKTLHSLKDFFNKLKDDGSLIDDLSLTLCEQINTENDREILKEKTKYLLSGLYDLFTDEDKNPKTRSNLNVFTTKFLSISFNKIIDIRSPKKERINTLIGLLDNGVIASLQFTGYINNFDFEGVQFYRCRFEKIVWSNCKFNDQTVFKDCYFIGGDVYSSDKFGMAKFEACSFDREAESIISNEKIKTGNTTLEKTDIQRDMEEFIKYFTVKDGIFKPKQEKDIIKGYLSSSPYRDKFINIMLKHVVNRNGIYLELKPESKPDVSDHLTNGGFRHSLAKAQNELVDELITKGGYRKGNRHSE